MEQEGRLGKARRDGDEGFPLAVGEVEVAGGVFDGLGDQHIPVVADQLLPEDGGIAGGRDHVVDDLKEQVEALVRDGVHHAAGALSARGSDGAGDQLGGDGQSCPRAQLQEADGIAHTALGLSRDEAGGLLGEVDLLLAGDLMEAGAEVGGGDAAEVEALATGDDGGGELLQLGGGQDEDHVLGRLLQSLQQSVKGRGREHMHLVDDVNTVFQLGGGIDDLVADIADIVHAVVGGGIHLQHVGGRSRIDGAAGGALPAGARGGGVEAVDRLGQDLGAGGLTRTAGAAEQVGVGELPRGALVFQYGRDVILAVDLVEVRRPPLAVKSLMHGKILLVLNS